MCDCDEPSVCVTTMRKARKDHRCCECREVIPKGNRYEYVSGVWDGRGASFKTCLACVDLRGEVIANLPAYYCPPCFGDLLEEAREQGLRT